MKFVIHKILLFFFFFACSFTEYSQNNIIDSLQNVLQTQKEDTLKANTLNDLAIAWISNGDYQKAVQPAKQALALSEKLDFKNGKASAYTNLGWTHFYDNTSEAAELFLKAISIKEEIHDKAGAAEINQVISNFYAYHENNPEAINYQYRCLHLYESLKDTFKIAHSYQRIGTYFLEQNNSEALKNYFASLRLFEKLGIKKDVAASYYYIGKIYSMQNKYDEALKMDSAALKVFKEENNEWMIAWTESGIGHIYEKRNKPTIALQCYLSAMTIFRKIGEEDYANGMYTDIGGAYTILKNFKLASDYLQNALVIGQKKNEKETLRYTYENLAILDSAQGNYKRAYEDYRKFISYRDSLVNDEGIKKSEGFRLQYEFDKKEAVAKAEQEKKDAKAKLVKNKQYFIIGGLGILVLAVLLIASIQWRNNKHKQKANVLLQQQKKKVESTLSELKATQSQLIQSEKMASLGELTAGIAHEIQNPLNFVNNFAEINNELIKELEEVASSEIRDASNEAEIIATIKENSEKINHHGKRAESIVKGMLQHSRKSTGIKEPTDINALTDEYLRLAYLAYKSKNPKDAGHNDLNEINPIAIGLITELDPSLPLINVIPQDIGRVLLNLFNNAFWAVNEKQHSLSKKGGDDKNQNGEDQELGSPSGVWGKSMNLENDISVQPPTPKGENFSAYQPVVTLTTKNLGDKIEIRISDNGPGIPSHIIDKIFQPFFTTKPTGQGTGLGLSLAYDIIKAHQGELKVKTKEVEGLSAGKAGSEFIIQLPTA